MSKDAIAKVRKAIAGAVTAGLSAYVLAAPDGVSLAEVGTIVAAVVVGGLAVYWTPNKPAGDA